MKKAILILTFVFQTLLGIAQKDSLNNSKASLEGWYKKVNLRGYAQVRLNGLYQSNPNLSCEQCDRSWGTNNSFFFRRIRLIFFGQIHPRVYLYIQPDFASSASSTALHFAQIRDAYFDVSLDKKGEFRIRLGQSKIPFGFENMQSSQNRLPLDRADALNSALSNERDLGAIFYWAPFEKRKLFADLVSQGLKGSGDYGILGLGFYNGQTANRPELNSNKHFVARATWPFKVKSQIIEPSIQFYTGQYSFGNTFISPSTKLNTDNLYLDRRVAGTFVLYPKPFGILLEANYGRGPIFNAQTDSIEVKPLAGGFLTMSYKIDLKKQTIIPYTRLQYYSGGKKHETDARSHLVKEIEAGVEWQPNKNFELVTAFVYSDRATQDFVRRNYMESGFLLRIQAQVNF